MKLNSLLGKTDALAPSFKTALKDYAGFFKSSQGAFRGERKEYTQQPNTIDIPGNRALVKIQTTVSEKLQWLIDGQSDYIDSVLDQEATNAAGVVKAELVVNNISWGMVSSLELLRLKSIIDSQEFKLMNENLPVRSDAQVWVPTRDEMYLGREVFETKVQEYEEKTTDKKSVILADPNLTFFKDVSGYKPQVATETTVSLLGSGTRQSFSGEWSQRQKAEVLKRIFDLKIAIVTALKECNEAEVIKSELSAERLFSYIYS